ncbi:hypothetical protein [Apibacter sp.]|uniref:hypothetical protein n=1 Tax=Apibacter sp. TaxID=2023709 RepID=UPI0025FEACE2|nr:hypothetical protein [Apibacter sp.]MCT6868754.1 hypothetical protein [Apibacter sp.]
MKNIIFLIVTLISFNFTLTSCSDDDNNNYVPIVENSSDAMVHSFTVVKFDRIISKFTYAIDRSFVNKLQSSSNVLVYRQVGFDNIGNPEWELMPSQYSIEYIIPGNSQVEKGTLTYYHTFSTDGFTIYADADYDIDFYSPEAIHDQTFRIVVIPGIWARSNQSMVNYKNYNEVIKYYHIDESKITTLQPIKK